MDSRKIVFQQTLTVAAGELVCCALMCAVFALLGFFSAKVVYGAVVGGVLAVANFLIMALCANTAADKAEAQDAKGGKTLIQLSYMGRMIGLLVVLVLCAKSGWFDLLALVIPLVFVRPVLTAVEYFKRKGEKKV